MVEIYLYTFVSMIMAIFSFVPFWYMKDKHPYSGILLTSCLAFGSLFLSIYVQHLAQFL